jgi:hypothetical protein
MNRFFAIYNILTGIINKTQTCSDIWDPTQLSIRISLSPGEAYLEVPFGTNYTNGHVVDGVFVPDPAPPVDISPAKAMI